jgi:hypothetical protein
MKNTAVEYLFEKLWETPKDKLTWNAILEQGNKMFEQQIIDAYETGDKYKFEIAGQKYYNNTYDK